MKIVVIDDEVDIGFILAMQFKLNGHDAVSFDKIPDAQKFVEQQAASIDVIICDFKMPVMNGLDFFNWAKSHKFIGKFYMLTGEPQMDTESLLAAGVTRVLFKPQDLNFLNDILKT